MCGLAPVGCVSKTTSPLDTVLNRIPQILKVMTLPFVHRQKVRGERKFVRPSLHKTHQQDTDEGGRGEHLATISPLSREQSLKEQQGEKLVRSYKLKKEKKRKEKGKGALWAPLAHTSPPPKKKPSFFPHHCAERGTSKIDLKLTVPGDENKTGGVSDARKIKRRRNVFFFLFSSSAFRTQHQKKKRKE